MVWVAAKHSQLASLLDTNCSIRYLGLGNEVDGDDQPVEENIDDECVTVLANSLKCNKQLRRINFHGNCIITSQGWQNRFLGGN